jgi:hypothetical protein
VDKEVFQETWEESFSQLNAKKNDHLDKCQTLLVLVLVGWLVGWLIDWLIEKNGGALRTPGGLPILTEYWKVLTSTITNNNGGCFKNTNRMCVHYY